MKLKKMVQSTMKTKESKRRRRIVKSRKKCGKKK